MNREDIIRMAREAGAAMIHGGEHALMGDFALETFFQKAYAAGAAAEREKEKKRQLSDIHSCGPDCDRYICVAVRKAREEEREACAKVCDEQGVGRKALEHYAALTYLGAAHDCAAAIRARGQQ